MIPSVTLQTTSTHSACTLPYPDRFHAAVNFIVNNTPGDAPLNSGALVVHCMQTQAWIYHHTAVMRAVSATPARI